MRQITLIVALMMTGLSSMAQCEPEHTFYPAIIFGISTGPGMQLQAGLQGQRTPFSMYGGVRTYKANEDPKTKQYEVGLEPYVEIDARWWFRDPIGVFVYAAAGPHAAGGGLGMNVRADGAFGFRVKAGYEKGFTASGGFILLLH